MKLITSITLILILISCTGRVNSIEKNNNALTISDSEITETIDSLLYYWEPNYEIYSFDTIINQTSFQMRTYCLNDSAIFSETSIDERSENKNHLKYSVAHNYATDISIKTDSTDIKLHLLKENFKDSLPNEFFKICHMWKNEFSHIDNNQLVFRATLAKPDTDYQYAVLYLISNKGEFIIQRVEDESYHGSEDE